MTTPANSPSPLSPETSSNPWSGSIVRWWRNINDWIKGLSPSGAQSFETKFVTVAPGILWRRWGKVVEIRCARDGSFSPGENLLASGVIPSEALPSGTNRRGAAFLGGSHTGHIYVGSTTGNVYVMNSTGVTVSTAQGSIIYTLD